MKGLCGDFNGDPGDDLKMASGAYAEDFIEFAQSYQVGQCTLEPGTLKECTEQENEKW